MFFRISLFKRLIYRIVKSQILLGARTPVRITKTQVKTIYFNFIREKFNPSKVIYCLLKEKSSQTKNLAYLTDSEHFICLLKKHSRLQHLSQSDLSQYHQVLPHLQHFFFYSVVYFLHENAIYFENEHRKINIAQQFRIALFAYLRICFFNCQNKLNKRSK